MYYSELLQRSPFCIHLFSVSQRVEVLAFLWRCPSGSFSFILRYSQSSTLEFVTIAGWVCCVCHVCRLFSAGRSHGPTWPFRGQAAMFSNRFRTRADHEYLKSTSGALIEMHQQKRTWSSTFFKGQTLTTLGETCWTCWAVGLQNHDISPSTKGKLSVVWVLRSGVG